MISNYKKQEFINEINVLLHGMELARINGEQIDKSIEEAKNLKSQIEAESDITLEETMETARKDVNLEIESDIELKFRMEIERIKAGMPSRLLEIATIREQQEEMLPDWLKIAFIEHPEWEEKCISIIAQDLEDIDYTRLVYSIHELFAFLPLEERTKIPEICEKVVNTNPELLKFVPISVIESNPDLWSKYFYEEGIDIELFIEYDKKIKENISRDIPVKEGAIEKLIKARQNGYWCVMSLPEEIKQRFPRTTNAQPINQDKEKVCNPPEEEKYQILTDEDAQKYKKKVEEYPWQMDRMPIEFLRENKEWCMKLCENDVDVFRHLPEQFKLENPEWTMKFSNVASYYIPEKVKLDNPEECMRLVSCREMYFSALPDQIKLANPEWSIKNFHSDFRYLPNSIKLSNLSWCMKFVEKNPIAYQNEVPIQIALANIDWYKSICKRSEEQWKLHRFEFNFDEAKFEEEFKKRIIDLENKYMSKFNTGELDLESLKEDYSMILDKEHIIEIQQKRVPTMRSTYQGIAQMEDEMQDEYLKRANELAEKYVQLMKDKVNVRAEEMTKLISSIAMLEMEIRTKNNEFKERKAAEEAYKQTKDEITRKIAQIKGINPELAKQYTEELQANESANINYRAKTGMVSPEEIEISNQVDFYVNANFRKEEQYQEREESKITDMTVYKEPTKKGFWARLIDKIRGKSSNHEVQNKQNKKATTQYRETIKVDNLDLTQPEEISETPKKEQMREDNDEQQQ